MKTPHLQLMKHLVSNAHTNNIYIFYTFKTKLVFFLWRNLLYIPADFVLVIIIRDYSYLSPERFDRYVTWWLVCKPVKQARFSRHQYNYTGLSRNHCMRIIDLVNIHFKHLHLAVANCTSIFSGLLINFYCSYSNKFKIQGKFQLQILYKHFPSYPAYYITRKNNIRIWMRTCADRWAGTSKKHTHLFMKEH